MSLINEQTSIIDGKIALLKIIADKNTKKLTKTNVDVQNLIDSILHILNQLGGYNDMIKTIEDILSKNLDNIEETVKSAIKIALKEIISCSVEPTIGDELILSGTTFDLKKIDPMSIFSIEPTSENGAYVYFDNNYGIDSTDFNVFLYTIIEQSINNTNYNGANWFKTTTINSTKIKTPLFKASYKEFDNITSQSNILTIKINENFEKQKLNFFISEYLDSVKLFKNVNIISSIFDELLNTNIISINKTSEQLETEKKLKIIIDKLINNLNSEIDVIDDSFYTFSNDTYNLMLENAQESVDGLYKYSEIDNTKTNLNKKLILDSLNGLTTDNLTISEQTKILQNTVDNISNDLNQKGVVKDKYVFTFKYDFIKEIISKLTSTLTMYVFSPKIIYLFYMVSKLYGLEDSNDIIDFIKKHINILKIIIIKIRDIIVQSLIDKIKEKVSVLLETVMQELIKEKFSIYKSQIDGIRNAIENVISTANTLVDISKTIDDTITDKADKIISQTI